MRFPAVCAAFRGLWIMRRLGNVVRTACRAMSSRLRRAFPLGNATRGGLRETRRGGNAARGGAPWLGGPFGGSEWEGMEPDRRGTRRGELFGRSEAFSRRREIGGMRREGLGSGRLALAFMDNRRFQPAREAAEMPLLGAQQLHHLPHRLPRSHHPLLAILP